MWIDTHCHLYLPQFDEDREETVERSEKAGVGRLIVPNVDSETYPAFQSCCRLFPEVCRPALGLHPCSVRENFEEELAFVERHFDDSPVVAVGEIGLDYYWDKTFIPQQKEAFRRQAGLALEKQLPVIIHTRDSVDDMIALVKEFPGLKGVFHCFSGNVKQAEEITGLGFFLGIGGVVTFNNSGLQDIVKNISAGFLLPETDAPYLAPAPWRGKRNEPSYIPLIGRKMAELKGMDEESLAEITTRNADKLFSLHL